jgi:serine/threonine protein kinase
MSVCLSQQLVECYIAGNCSADQQQTVELHLSQCENCRRRIESARSSTAASQEAVEKPPINQDQYPTESVAHTTAFPYAKNILPKSLESPIEGYEIIEELPRGGQAVVYKAIHTATKTNVAIKVLLPTLLASKRARYYFEREAELIATLEHPNIVGIRDSGIIHGQYYFVMQYIEGQFLNQYVNSQKLSFRERMVLFNKVCSAVSYAHQQGIIHRDLKFANILVDKRGEPHILDFGLAKAVGLSERAGNRAVVTMTGEWAGSLSTMSPEQASGRPNLINVRTDVYSLGVILYHMLTGQYPYDITGSTLEVLQNIQKAEPTRPRQINRKFDPDVEAILLAALAKDPARRYQSAADLHGDIENWLQGRPIRVRSISTMYLLRKIIARHRYTSTVVALLLLIVLGFSLVTLDLYVTARKAQQEAEANAQQLTSEVAKSIISSRQITPLCFVYILQAWHDGRNKDAYAMGLYLKDGSKEKKAAFFLLDPVPLAKKEARFVEALSAEYAWFADFIIAEHYLKDGNRQQALEAYQRSYKAIEQLSQDRRQPGDWFVIDRVKARIYELTTAVKPPEKVDKSESENVQ